jgi:hypothetical protein
VVDRGAFIIASLEVGKVASEGANVARGQRSRHRVESESCVLKPLICGLKQKSVRRIHGLCFFGCDGEERRVKCLEVLLQEVCMSMPGLSLDSNCYQSRVLKDSPWLYAAKTLWIWVVETIDVVSIFWYLRTCRAALNKHVPESLWI